MLHKDLPPTGFEMPMIDPSSVFHSGAPTPIRSYKVNKQGSVVGYLGRQRAVEFGSDQGAAQRAIDWVNDPNPVNVGTPITKDCIIDK